jgi:hypothetical protein
MILPTESLSTRIPPWLLQFIDNKLVSKNRWGFFGLKWAFKGQKSNFIPGVDLRERKVIFLGPKRAFKALKWGGEASYLFFFLFVASAKALNVIDPRRRSP